MMIDPYFWVGYQIDGQGKISRLDPKSSPMPMMPAAPNPYLRQYTCCIDADDS